MAATATEAQQEKQEKKKVELLQQFNQLIDLAVSKGKRFSVGEIEAMEKTGTQARAEREAGRMSLMTPAKESQGPVARAVPRREAGEAVMTRQAIQAALKLAEGLELASRPVELRMKAWIDAGRAV